MSLIKRFVGGMLTGLLVLVAIYGAWTLYDNSVGPASVGPAAAPGPTSGPAGALSPTAARAMRAYGGGPVWAKAATVTTTVTVGGLLFQLKGVNVPPHATFTIDKLRPHTVIKPVDSSGDIGTLDGFSVVITSPAGKVIGQRADARTHLRNETFTTKWDRLDLVYFLGYALWSYNTLPYQLTRTDIKWTELQDGELQAEYGPNLPAHSRIQRFWFDTKTGLLRRNDYTPEAATPTARAANIVYAHGVSDGIPYPSKRRVKDTPQQYGWVLPAPDLVTLDVEKWRLT